MKKRILAIFAACILAVGLLSACSSAQSGATDAASDVAEDVTDAASDVAEDVTDAASDAADAASDAVEDVSEAAASATDGVLDWDGWMAEQETDVIYYKDIDGELGEITTDMVPDDFSIGVVSMASSNNYWIDVSEGIQKRCDELGITCQIEYVEGPADFEDTLNNAEKLYNQGFDAYIYSPENETCLDDITNRIVAEGTPVINAYCCELAGATCFIGSLDSQVAQAAAQLAIDTVGEDGVVGVAMGDVGGKLAQTRTRYYEAYLKDNSNVLCEEIPAQWDPSTARTMTTDLLTANPDVGFIFCNNDDLGLGVYEGLREAGANETCKVVAMDGTTQGLSSVKDGEMYGTYWNNPKLIGELSVDACVRAALGQDLPRVIRTDFEFVTADNVDEYLGN